MKDIEIGKFKLASNGSLLNTESGTVRELLGKECGLLRYLHAQEGNVVRKEDAVEAVWGTAEYFNIRSADVYITRLCKFLHDDSTVRLEIFVGYGWRLIVGVAANDSVELSDLSILEENESPQALPRRNHLKGKKFFLIAAATVAFIFFYFLFWLKVELPRKASGFIYQKSLTDSTQDTLYTFDILTKRNSEIKRYRCSVSKEMYYTYKVNDPFSISSALDVQEVSSSDSDNTLH